MKIPLNKVKSILISQPVPKSIKSPYKDLEDSQKVKIDYCPFIYTEGVDYREFRKTKIELADYNAIIFTSRNAIDYFFSLMKKLRIQILPKTKYYCISESTAYYLQKYIIYKKRSIFYANTTFLDLEKEFKNNASAKFILPCADILNPKITDVLDNIGVEYTKAIMYKTLCSDLSELKDIMYDVLVFFSPTGITSLFQNFPDFKQGNTRIAVFGSTTLEAAKQAGLVSDIYAPQPEAPSMSKALELYIKKANQK